MALQLCRLGIVLLGTVLLLAGKSEASYRAAETTIPPNEVTTTPAPATSADEGGVGMPTTASPYSAYENEDQYEVIDVAEHSHHAQGGQVRQSAGDTTRFYTTGEVDEKFWLTHLGEDFKHAIHLLVGGNEQYADIYNSTKPGGYVQEVHHEYLGNSNGDQQQEQHYQPSSSYGANESSKDQSNAATTTNHDNAFENLQRYDQSYDQQHNREHAIMPTAKQASSGNYEQQPYENVFKMDDTGISSTQYNGDSYYVPPTSNNYAAKYAAPAYEQPTFKPQQTVQAYEPSSYRPQQTVQAYEQPSYKPQQTFEGYELPSYKPQHTVAAYERSMYKPQQPAVETYERPMYKPQQPAVETYERPAYKAQHTVESHEEPTYKSQQHTVETYEEPSYTSNKDTQQPYTYTYDKQYTAKQRAGEEPVIVTLPENSDTGERPLVVSMPPVIYHGYPTATENKQASADETQTQHDTTPEHYTHTYKEHVHKPHTHLHLHTHTQSHNRPYANTGYALSPRHSTVYATPATHQPQQQYAESSLTQYGQGNTDDTTTAEHYKLTGYYRAPPLDVDSLLNARAYSANVIRANILPRHYRNILVADTSADTAIAAEKAAAENADNSAAVKNGARTAR